MDPQRYVNKGTNVSCATIAGKAYIYLEDRHEILRLDDTGTFVWSQINGHRRADDIVSNCVEEYEGDPDEIQAAVTCFLQELNDLGTIVFAPRPFERMAAHG